MQSPNRLVYTHIAKAGGRSVGTFLAHISGACRLNGLNVSGASSVIAAGDLSPRVFNQQNLNKDDYEVIVGHMPFCQARRHFMPARFATVLRDPRWQLLSNYCSQPTNKCLADFGMSRFIGEIRANPYAEWALSNYQTRMLANQFNPGEPVTREMLAQAQHNLMHHYGIVGRSDDLDEVLRALSYLYSVPFVPWARKFATGPYMEYVTDEHLDFAAAWNALDMELYDWMIQKELFVNSESIRAISAPIRAESDPIRDERDQMRASIVPGQKSRNWPISLPSILKHLVGSRAVVRLVQSKVTPRRRLRT